ncbi:MAG: TonB-dependent receptor [Pseudomonadales bacterium]|nr:TonB-dependent receptor [Pseudomonadales bacterium]
MQTSFMYMPDKSACLLLFLLLLPLLPLWAGTPLAEEVFSLSLEELLNIEISVASRNETAAFENPAAVYVITQADIRASGLRSIPELLRMVPGLHVSRFSGGQWEVSSRNKTRRFSGYLLVAIDGRAVHNPLFGGVFWDMQNTPLADIERIEIVRGPGATTWGSNAVNGVINIITKSSVDTQDTYISAGVGDNDIQQDVFLRHGFLFNDMHGRVYLSQKKYNSGLIPPSTSNDDAPLSPPFDAFNQGADAGDNGVITQAGFRVDKELNQYNWTIQGDIYQGGTGEYDGSADDRQVHYDDIHGFNFLSKWQVFGSDFSQTRIQVYIDEFGRKNKRFYALMDQFSFDVRTVDIDIQHHFPSGHHQWALGLGYRYMQMQTEIQGLVNQSGILINPAGEDDHLPSAFIQDSIALMPNKLQLIMGIKAEINDYSGSEFQPSIRMLWSINSYQNVWMAYSLANKSPVLLDDEIYADNPDLSALDNDEAACVAAGQIHRFGWLILPEAGCVQNESIHADSQKVRSTELGYRWQGENRSIDIALFYDDYEVQEFIVDTFVDKLYGAEFSLNYHINDSWQGLFNYTRHQGKDFNFFSAEDFTKTTTDISKNTLYLRLSYHPLEHWLIYSNLYYVDDIDGPVPAYTRLDLQLQWLPNPSLTVSLNGTNLLDDSHIEENVQLFSIIPTEIQRGYFLSFSYDFAFQ